MPYLRNKLFPRHRFKSMYEERDVRSRMESKIRRTFRRPPPTLASSRILQVDARRLRVDGHVDAIITSPPYMNELDYVRDNRLRLWFIERGLPSVKDIPRKGKQAVFRSLLTRTFSRLSPVLAPNSAIVVVVGDTRRGGRRTDTAKVIKRTCSQAANSRRCTSRQNFMTAFPTFVAVGATSLGRSERPCWCSAHRAQVHSNAKAAS